MKIRVNKSVNFSKKTRSLKNIQYLIIHYTGMQSARVSMKRLKNPSSKVSCHYFIDRNGDIYKMIDETKVAWHAGKSKWRNFVNLNINSLGIELVNKGHKLGYQNFSQKQINSLLKILSKLKKKYKIKNSNILGHSDIAPLRKIDPGEKFPWKKILRKSFNSNLINKNLIKNYSEKGKRIQFFKNLYKIGYRYFNINRPAKNDVKVVKAFQRKYLQTKIDGKIDQKTFEISHFLANRT